MVFQNLAVFRVPRTIFCKDIMGEIFFKHPPLKLIFIKLESELFEIYYIVINETKLNFMERYSYKMHSHCFARLRGHGNFAFHLVVKLSVELGYVFLSLRL
jgi:hypothetical protein